MPGLPATSPPPSSVVTDFLRVQAIEDRLQRANEVAGAASGELVDEQAADAVDVGGGGSFEQRQPVGGEDGDDASAVVLAGLATDVAAGHEPVDGVGQPAPRDEGTLRQVAHAQRVLGGAREVSEDLVVAE
jgi:hypothetical protein